MKPIELKAEYRELALQRQARPNPQLDLRASPGIGGFIWSKTPEGFKFWNEVNDGGDPLGRKVKAVKVAKKDRPKERVHIKKKSKKVRVGLSEEWNKHEPVKINIITSEEGIKALDEALDVSFKKAMEADYKEIERHQKSPYWEGEKKVMEEPEIPSRCELMPLKISRWSTLGGTIDVVHSPMDDPSFPCHFVPPLYNTRISVEGGAIEEIGKEDKKFDERMEGYLEEYIQEALKGPKEEWVEKLKMVFYKFWK